LAKLKDPKKNGEISDDAINAFLSKDQPENWTNAYLALQLHAYQLISTLGLKAEIMPESVKNLITPMPNGTMRLGVDESMFRKIYTDTILPWASRSSLNTGGRRDPRVGRGFWGIGNAFNVPNVILHPGTIAATIGPIIAGALTANPAVAAAGLIAPALTLLGKAGREGVTLDTRRQGRALQSILVDSTTGLRNDREIKFMKKMTGINLDNYQVDAAGNITLMPGQSHEITKDPNQTLYESLKLMITGMEFLTTAGVPFKNVDATFAQFLNAAVAGPNQYRMEQTGFKGSARVFNEYKAQGGYHADFAVRAQRVQRAFAKVIARDMREQIDDERKAKERKASAEQLGEHEKSLTEAETKRKADAGERQTQLGKDKTALDEEITKVKEYGKAIEDSRQERENKVLKSRADLNLLFNTVALPGGVAFGDVAAMNTALAQVLSAPVGVAVPGVIIEGRLIQSTQRRLRAARTAYAKAPRDRDLGDPAAVPPIPPESVQRYDHYHTVFAAEKAERFNEAKGEIDKDIKIINDTLAKIKEANSPVQGELKNNLLETSENVSAIARIFARQREDFADVLTWGVTAPQLGVEPIDRLNERINTANRANPAFGWPEHQNNLRANRQRLLNAILEARAETISPLITAPEPEFTKLIAAGGIAPGGWELTENQLLTLSSEQIQQLLIDKQSRNPRFHLLLVGAPLSFQEIELAKDNARERLRARLEAMDQLSLRLDREAQTAGATEEAPTKMRLERTARLKKLMEDNQESILGEATEIALNPNVYFDSMGINPLDEEDFTPAERATYNLAGVPTQYTKGYLRFIDTIFDYRKKGNSREIDKAFQEYAGVLTPDRIALAFDEILIEATPPLIGPPRPPRNDINLVFSEILTLANNRGLYSNDIQKVLQKIIGDLAGRTPIAAI
ncbi:hypothetical protein M1307_00930, partial [Patescibacteria group bacterium]|nr:hypothetical protein [Patescibacteria group bacterium]